MFLQDDASPRLPNGFDVASSLHQDSDQTENSNDLENKNIHSNIEINSPDHSFVEDESTSGTNTVNIKSSSQPHQPNQPSRSNRSNSLQAKPRMYKTHDATT